MRLPIYCNTKALKNQSLEKIFLKEKILHRIGKGATHQGAVPTLGVSGSVICIVICIMIEFFGKGGFLKKSY
jgi:hypothetical protein